MEILGIIVLIIVAIMQSSKKQEKKGAPQQNRMSESAQRVRTTSSYSGSSQYQANESMGEKPWEKAARENIEKAARRAAAVANKALNEIFMDEGTQMTMDLGGSAASTSNSASNSGTASYSKGASAPASKDSSENEISAAEQIRKRRLENRHTSILDRAKDNTEEQAEDVTLNTMEAEHNHSERVSPAKHHHPEDVIPESMLGSVDDLMIKGYDGNLCFERDFVGEAMDMINRFTVPSDIPEYSGEKAS